MMKNPVNTLPDAEKLRVLAVEDNPDAMNQLRNMLKEIGINQVYTATDGKQALDFLGNCDEMIDVVLADWHMPRMTGLELLTQVRTVEPQLPFLMITGAADMDSVIEAKAKNVTGFLRKPYSVIELHKKLMVVARLCAARKEAGA